MQTRTLIRLALSAGLGVCLGAATAQETNPATEKKTAVLGGFTPAWTATPHAGFYINSVAISGDGNRVVGGTFFHKYALELGPTADIKTPPATYGTYCYDRTGRLVWKDEFNGWEGVYWVDVSTDGAWAASGGWFSQSPLQGFVRAYDANAGNTVLDYRTTSRVNQVALSADGRWLVSAAKTLVLFRRLNGAFQKADEYGSGGANENMETIGLSADGRTLVAANYLDGGGTVMLFSIDPNAGKFGAPVTWKLPQSYSHSIRITPDGRAFAAGGSSGNIYLFDSAQFRTTKQPAITFNIPQAGSIYGVAIAGDASGFAGIANKTGGKGAIYYVQRQGNTGTLKWSAPTQHNPNSAVINSSIGLVAVADGHPDGTPGAFYLFDAATGAQRGQYTTSNMSWPIAIAAGGSAVAAGSDDANIYYFKLPPGTAEVGTK